MPRSEPDAWIGRVLAAGAVLAGLMVFGLLPAYLTSDQRQDEDATTVEPDPESTGQWSCFDFRNAEGQMWNRCFKDRQNCLRYRAVVVTDHLPDVGDCTEQPTAWCYAFDCDRPGLRLDTCLATDQGCEVSRVRDSRESVYRDTPDCPLQPHCVLKTVEEAVGSMYHIAEE